LSVVETAVDGKSSNVSNVVAGAFTENILNCAKELAKENAVTVAQAEQVVKQNANIIAREVEYVKTQSEIRQNEAKVEYERYVANAHNDELKLAKGMSTYSAKSKQIEEDFKREVEVKINETTKELTQKSTEAILQKAEEKKKSTVEDDVRARLRGFARTIPAFLMAFGTPATTLANFDQNITDSVFKEVTGITLDQFRTLRDTYEFFDSGVFDESISEFLRKKEKLADYFDESLEEDIFDYIPNQKTNQIFTPKRVVKMMIDMLEEENPDIWSDKDKTFVNLYIKSGMYMVEIVKRLYKGLEKVIPDRNERLKHILENQVFGFAPTEIIYNIAKTFIYGNHHEIDTKNLQCKDLTEIAKSGGDLGVKFDVVVGNPPYQEEAGGTSTQDLPVYPYFYDLAKNTAPKYVLIIMV
jgi:type II restriction enzyme